MTRKIVDQTFEDDQKKDNYIFISDTSEGIFSSSGTIF